MGCSGCNDKGNNPRKKRYVPGAVGEDGAFIRFTAAELDWILAAFKNSNRPKGGLNESIFKKVKAGGLKDVGTFAEAGALWNWLIMGLDGSIDIAEMFGTMNMPNAPTDEIYDLANRLQELATRLESTGLRRPNDAPIVEEADGETDEEESGDDQEADRRE